MEMDEEITPQSVVTNIDKTIVILELKARRLNYECANLFMDAKECFSKNDKMGAQKLLKTRKIRMKDRQRQLDICLQFEEIKSSIENAITMISVTKNMKMSENVLENSLKGLDLNDIEKMMESIQTKIEASDDITDVLATDIDQTYYDITDDLDRIEQELADEVELPNIIKKEKEEEIIIVKNNKKSALNVYFHCYLM